MADQHPKPPFIELDDAEAMKAVKELFPIDESRGRTGPREYQLETIFKIVQAFKTHRYVAVNAPTGSGKSVLAYAVASVMNKYGKRAEGVEGQSYAAVPYKTLQEQYLRDFDLALMKGASNYPCYFDSSTPCNLSPCRLPVYDTKKVHEHAGQCPYAAAKRAVHAHPHALFNLAAYLTFMDHTEEFGPRPFVVVDEAHTLESALMQYVAVAFHSESLSKFGIVDIPNFEKPSDYVVWVEEVGKTVRAIKKSLLDQLGQEAVAIGCSLYSLLTKEQKSLLSLASEYEDRAYSFLDAKDNIDSIYVCSYYSYADKQSIEFKPVIVAHCADRYFFQYGGCYLFLSATLYIEDFCRSLGLEREEVEYFEIKSTFPDAKQRRPFIVDGHVGSLNNKNLESKLSLILKRIEEIALRYESLKGIIHTHTYKITNYIIQHASPALKKRLISHKGGDIEHGLSREEALEEHIKRSDPTILISPMMYEGVDLKDDLARWQIIVKVPYSSLVDPQVKRRLEVDPEWYQWQTVLKVIQAYGRLVRSKRDWGYTIMLDRNFLTLYDRCSDMFFDWFKEAIIVKKEVMEVEHSSV